MALDRASVAASAKKRAVSHLPPALLGWVGARPPSDGTLSISPPFRDPSAAGDRLYLVRRRIGPGHSAFDIVPIPPAMLLELTGSDPSARNMQTMIVGKDGIVRARAIDSRIVSGDRETGSAWAQATLGTEAPAWLAKDDRAGTYAGHGAVDRIARYASAQPVPGYPLIVVSVVAAGSVLDPPDWFGRVHLAGAIARTLAVLVIAFLAFRAIDAQVRRELALAENNRRLLIAQMMGRMGEWSWDAASDIVWRSPVLDWLYGDQGPQKKTLAEILPRLDPDDRREVEEAFRQVMATGDPREFQRQGRLPDGTRPVRRVIVYPTRDAEGVITGVHGIDQDITTAKRLESLESRIVQLSRLDAMHLMAATLAHEINQPLAAAANYLAASRRMLAQPGMVADPEIGDMIHSGEMQVRHAGEIVRRVREMVTKRDERGPVKVSIAWHKAMELVEAVTEGRILRFETDISGDAGLVIADEVQLSQVFTNLMRNAVEAVVAGPVLIGLRARLGDQGSVRLEVRDNGAGIAVPDHDVFAPLSTTKETGFGLGLVISRTIVEAHGGRIWIESSGGEGTVVAFTLKAGAV